MGQGLCTCCCQWCCPDVGGEATAVEEETHRLLDVLGEESEEAVAERQSRTLPEGLAYVDQQLEELLDESLQYEEEEEDRRARRMRIQSRDLRTLRVSLSDAALERHEEEHRRQHEQRTADADAARGGGWAAADNERRRLPDSREAPAPVPSSSPKAAAAVAASGESNGGDDDNLSVDSFGSISSDEDYLFV